MQKDLQLFFTEDYSKLIKTAKFKYGKEKQINEFYRIIEEKRGIRNER